MQNWRKIVLWMIVLAALLCPAALAEATYELDIIDASRMSIVLPESLSAEVTVENGSWSLEIDDAATDNETRREAQQALIESMERGEQHFAAAFRCDIGQIGITNVVILVRGVESLYFRSCRNVKFHIAFQVDGASKVNSRL